MENLSFQYPTWYLILCFLLGLTYALVLYFRNDTFKDRAGWLNGLLGGLRFLTVSLLSILLLSPLLKSAIREVKKPIVVIAQDQSESVLNNLDSAVYANALDQLSDQLAADYELKQYAFGSEVREGIDFNFTDKVSNLSEVLQSLYDQYSNQNLGAVILATDGIYNEGSNPIYAGAKLSAPIYTVALGDTTLKKDLVLKRVFHNKIAYLGDKFGIQVDITAQNAVGSSTVLTISAVENGQLRRLQQFPLTIDQNDFFRTQEVILDADKSGVQRYRISLNGIEGEETRANNSKDIFVDILDARQKILLLANAPHPDLTAIRQSISTNKNYEVTIKYIAEPALNLAQYDFVVLHNLPSQTRDAAAALKVLNDQQIPRLFIVGPQTNFQRFTQVQPLVNITADLRNTNDVQASLNNAFNLFTIDDELRQKLPNFAPLVAPFGDFKENPNASVLLFQRIGKIDTKYPLLAFGEQNNTKIGVLCAEGIWKWRLFDYLQHQNHQLFDGLISKTFQYLTLKEDKRKFRVSLNKNIFNENEEIYFDAELYNQSYELINEPDVSLVITDEAGNDFNFTFDRNANRSYSLSNRSFPVGNYRFRASVMSGGEQLTYNGQFSVQPIQLEVYENTADHGLLRLLSAEYGGALFYPDQLDQLGTTIKEKGNILPVIYETTKTRPVIHLKWLFFLLLGLLTLEWFIRRYYGSY